MSKAKESTALTVYDASKFAVLDPAAGAEVIAAVQENLEGAEVRLVDLPKVTVPAGGATTWERADPTTGEVESAKAIEGIIVAAVSQRVYYASSIDESGGGSPPDCYSLDGQVGVGSPGGDCATCPFAQWGSDPKGGQGQACSQVMRLAVLEEGDAAFPIIVNVPPSSIAHIKRYLLGLTSKGKRRSRVITSLELERTTNANKIAYSVIRPKLTGALPAGVGEQVDAYAKSIERFIRQSVPASEPASARSEEDDS